MGNVSIAVRLRRLVPEEVHVSVPVSDDVMCADPEPDGSYRLDGARVFAEAVRIGGEDALDWRPDGVAQVEVHPVQGPPPGAVPPAVGAIARRWLDGFARHDLDGLLALYADDAVHTSPKLRARHPETGGQVRGKEALRAWWADAFARLPSLRYELVTLTVDRGRAFIEYVRQNPGDPDLMVAEVLEIDHGQIVASRVYHG